MLHPLYDRHRGNLAVELMHGGRWAGHSVHTALSDLPIGFWSGAIVLDLLGKDVPAGGDRLDPAATLSAAGLAAAVGTVATGVTDWTVSDGEDRRVGLFHGLLNAAGVALQAASLAARLTGHRRPAQALGVDQHDRDGGRRLRRRAPGAGPGGHGQPGRRHDRPEPLGPRGRRGRPPGRRHDRGRGRGPEGPAAPRRRRRCTPWTTCAAMPARLLSRGEVAGCVVTCPLHESRFDLRDGHIVRGPAHHPQPVLPARTRNGWIEVRGSQPRSRTARTRGEAHGVGSGS